MPPGSRYHGYPHPAFDDALTKATSLATLWNAVPVMTEFPYAADRAEAASAAGVAWAYYDYSSYCNVPDRSAEPNCTAGEACAFGACIT